MHHEQPTWTAAAISARSLMWGSRVIHLAARCSNLANACATGMLCPRARKGSSTAPNCRRRNHRPPLYENVRGGSSEIRAISASLSHRPVLVGHSYDTVQLENVTNARAGMAG